MNKNLRSLLIIFTRTPWRSFSMFLVVIIVSISSLFLLTLERNALEALKYYEYSPLNESRFTLTANTDIFSLFSHDSVGIESSVYEQLENDSEIESISRYTLVEIPVLAKFGMFQFSLETDMPIFAVSDSSLSGSLIPMGISQILIDFYNKEFSGTSPFFPLFTKEMVLGQKITLVFGKSKLFSLSSTPSSPLIGTITSVKNDYPGFGIMVSESLVKEKLNEIGTTLGNPYKIIGYMKNKESKGQIEKKYGAKYHLEFDMEAIEKLKDKTEILRYTIRFIGMVLASIFLIIYSFLLFGYARERSDLYKLFQTMGLNGIRSRFILLFEPMLLVSIGILLGFFVFRIMESLIMSKMMNFLLKKGIDFPLLPAKFNLMIGFSIGLFFLISFLVFSVDILMRKKRWI